MTFVQYTDITEQNLREQESANIAFFKPKYNGTIGVKVAMTQKRCVIGTQTSAEFDSKFCIRCTNLQRTVFENKVSRTRTFQFRESGRRGIDHEQLSLFDRFVYKKP